MVTRVDKKPVIYNTCLIRVWKPSVIASKKALLDRIRSISVGHSIPRASIRDLIDDFEDLDLNTHLYGCSEPAFLSLLGTNDEEEDEAIRIARMCTMDNKTPRQHARLTAAMDEFSGIHERLFSGASKIYYGTEAVYQFLHSCLNSMVFSECAVPNYKTWVDSTAQRVMITQSPYLMIHPLAVNDMSAKVIKAVGQNTWHYWSLYKKIETVAMRLSCRKNLLAHAFYYGVNRKGFEASENPLEDFEVPLSGFTKCRDGIKLYIIMGIRYVVMGEHIYCLTGDDGVNLSSMAQCVYRASVYFSTENGYRGGQSLAAVSLIKEILTHCCRLIDCGKNFSHLIRSMHILAQGDFNDIFENELGYDLGWKERSANYEKEALDLDPMGIIFHRKALQFAANKIDKLNVGFIYHVFVGDEMLIADLRDKVVNMTKKVRKADKSEWSLFIRFCKAYFLCRFMMVNKRKPRVGGDVTQMNESWANRCVAGNFTMPPRADWGRVWISKEFSYTNFADTWHLEAQDVAYVAKDSQGLADGKFRGDRFINSELLMAMTSGNVLDTLTGSTPKSARDRIKRGERVEQVVLTTAPKAENAKPSWKKRVTFAADCEFRKMQAEYDRNCRKIMSFVRGPSLGVDLCILEKQFADIAMATALGTQGGVCSHDISAWSESMDRDRKFEFEKVLTDMLEAEGCENIRLDWDVIKATVLKQGCKDVISIDNGSFQGFDGSACTILHSMILLYCIDSARRKAIIPTSVKTNMATLIDDCVAFMSGLTKQDDAVKFWSHLKKTYDQLGFEVDDLKSIFSTIKAIYLSRRFLCGGEVPADLKVFLKAHVSYEDPLRCSLDVPSDIFGAMRGAADANGDAWFIYICAVLSTLAELAHNNNCIVKIPPAAAAVWALAPASENGWGIPSILDWTTNDIIDKRSHFNAILESLAVHAGTPAKFQHGLDVYPREVGQAILALKSQPWRLVSYSNIFTNPFDAIREGPIKPDMLRRNSVQDMLKDIASASPWKELLGWNNSSTTNRVRELLIHSGPLHAPTLNALVNCMPDNYRLSMVGKAQGSQSLLDLLPRGAKSILKRRVSKCSQNFFMHSAAIHDSTRGEYSAADFAALSYTERTIMEREEFYAANGVTMTDHTFPDPVGSFTVSPLVTGSEISPNSSSLFPWDRSSDAGTKTNTLISGKGLYVPRRSGRVWEITSEYAKGWDTISQRIAMGLAVIARASADGHGTEGLLHYFVKSWNELSNITPRDTHLISINGSIKRLDANPGSATHPIIIGRNTLRGFNNKLKTALDVIPKKVSELSGNASHLHDFLSHETAMLATTALHFYTYRKLKVDDQVLRFNIATRPDCVVPESQVRMTTDKVAERIQIEIMDGADNYGLLQSCPELVREIAIPTMKSSWVSMINALIDGDHGRAEELRTEALSCPVDELLSDLADKEVWYTPAVILAQDPAIRQSAGEVSAQKYIIVAENEPQRATGDDYTTSVKTIGSKFSRILTNEQPDHIAVAIVMRSIVWERLRTRGCAALARIYYQDPDADLKVIEACATKDFWRAIVREVSRVKKHRTLSEALMLGFRCLGVPAIHIKATNDLDEATQATASFFGANTRLTLLLVADQILSVAGRSERNFSAPLMERIVTNNPALLNTKLKREHMNSIIEFNKKSLSERLSKLAEGDEQHRGDKRACEIDRHARLVELRCRLYVYLHTSVDEHGRAIFNESAHANFIHSCALKVAERFNFTDIPPPDANFAGTLKFMAQAEEVLNRVAKGAKHGWDSESGKIGSRLAYDNITVDSEHIAATRFAISASEIAPRIHKKVIKTPAMVAEEPEVPEAKPDDFIFDLFGDAMTLDDIGDDTSSIFNTGKLASLPIPAWQALYTLVLSGVYQPSDVNSKLGTGIPEEVRSAGLREAHMEDFDDAVILSAFPTLPADYVGAGMVFDPEWLNRDEADAYTTDELGRGAGAFLF